MTHGHRVKGHFSLTPGYWGAHVQEITFGVAWIEQNITSFLLIFGSSGKFLIHNDLSFNVVDMLQGAPLSFCQFNFLPLVDSYTPPFCLYIVSLICYTHLEVQWPGASMLVCVVWLSMPQCWTSLTIFLPPWSNQPPCSWFLSFMWGRISFFFVC